MVTRQASEKITRSFTVEELGNFSLIETNRALIIEDLLISKESSGRIIFKMNDGEHSDPFMFLDEEGTEHFSFNNGLMFWQGANLELENDSGLLLVTVGYYIVDGTNYQKWRLYKE